MNHLKAIAKSETELRVGNYMILFGGKDLVGEFFTPQTAFKSGYTDLGLLYVDFEHGTDPDRIGNDASCILGTIDWKSAKVDDAGIYVERILSRQAKYMKFIEELIDAGCMGTSSAAIPGKITKKSNGEIVEWPLMRDSLTVTPMEPRMLGANVLQAAKSLHAAFPHAKSLARLCGGVVVDSDREDSIEQIENLRDAEKFLRDAGMTRTQSKAFMSRMKTLGQRDADEEAEAKRVLDMLDYRRTMYLTPYPTSDQQ